MAMRNEPCKIDVSINVTQLSKLVRPKPKNFNLDNVFIRSY